ncbi:MAG: hypothetical protein IKX36_03710 [Prevotella sp.]|nr:hypothetical protein [Prevotella sp.]
MKKRLYLAVWLGVIILIGAALLIFENQLLWKIEETNLFLYSPLFFHEQMLVPGGLLSYIGCFFTQYLYHPWLGVLILCAWWWLLMWLTKRCFSITDLWSPVAILPVVFLLMMIINLGYWIYVLKLHGYFFVATIGTTAAVALLWGFRCMPEKLWVRTAYIVLTVIVGYPLLGVNALAAALLMGIWSWRLTKGKRALPIVCLAMAVFCVLVIPLLYYRQVYYQVSSDNIYWAALPRYFIIDRYDENYLPYGLLAIFYLLMIIFYKRERKTAIEQTVTTKKKASSKKNDNKTHTGKTTRVIVLQTILGIALAVFVFNYWYKDENFHRELSMQHYVERLEWQKVLDEAAMQKDEPSRPIVSMRNLALARLGRQGNEMCLFKNGAKRANTPLPLPAMLVNGIQLYYQYGMENECYRLGMENSVEFNFRVETLKLMAKCCILNGEDRLAHKYLDLLKQTRFHKDWALYWEKRIGDKKAQAEDPEMGFITHMMQYKNILGSDQGQPERYIMTQLARNISDDPVFSEQSLLATMWLRDDMAFWGHLNKYLETHPNGALPRYYQEAAYLFSLLPNNQVDVSNVPFNPDIKDKFAQFWNTIQRYEGAEMQMTRNDLYPFYGDTYYYDYYLMSNQ